jgi:signal peptidase II
LTDDASLMVARLLLVTLPLYILDQVSKWLVVQHVPEYSPIHVVPGFFNLVHTYNTGMAFGLMKDSNAFFIGLAIVALVVLCFMQWRKAFPGPVTQAAFLILLAGILGNLTDRIVHGHVIDFLEFYVEFGDRPHVWPSFNVADSCICIAATLFVITSFAAPPKRDQASEPVAPQ